MRFLIVLISVITAQAGVIERNCDGVTINDVYHDKELLHTGVDRPYLLAVDYSTNNLYFSYTVDVDADVFSSAKINLKTKQFDVLNVKNGFAQAVDQESHDVYIGTDQGIYKYDYGTNKAELFGLNGVDVWVLFFKDVLYYSTFPDQFLYTLINNESVRFTDLEDTKVDKFVIDNENMMFFSNATGLYGQTKGSKTAILYKELESDEVIRAISTDISGKAYVCTKNGIFMANKETNSLDQVLAINDCFGVTFDDKNRIIYADANSLYILQPSETKSC